MVRLMVTSKRVYAKATFLDCCRQCACPCGEPLLTHASTETLQHYQVVLF